MAPLPSWSGLARPSTPMRGCHVCNSYAIYRRCKTWMVATRATMTERLGNYTPAFSQTGEQRCRHRICRSRKWTHQPRCGLSTGGRVSRPVTPLRAKPILIMPFTARLISLQLKSVPACTVTSAARSEYGLGCEVEWTPLIRYLLALQTMVQSQKRRTSREMLLHLVRVPRSESWNADRREPMGRLRFGRVEFDEVIRPIREHHIGGWKRPRVVSRLIINKCQMLSRGLGPKSFLIAWRHVYF